MNATMAPVSRSLKEQAEAVERRRRRLGPDTYAYASELGPDKFEKVPGIERAVNPNVATIYRRKTPKTKVTLVDHDPDLDESTEYLGSTLNDNELIVADKDGKLMSLSTFLICGLTNQERSVLGEELKQLLIIGLGKIDAGKKKDLLLDAPESNKSFAELKILFAAISEGLKSFTPDPEIKDKDALNFDLGRNAVNTIQALTVINDTIELSRKALPVIAKSMPAFRLILNEALTSAASNITKLIEYDRAGFYQLTKK